MTDLANRCLRSFVALTLASVGLLSCKHFANSSEVKLKAGLPDLLNLAADPQMALRVCTEQLFFTFVGNAESLGDVEIPPNLVDVFGKELIANWTIAEAHRKIEYHNYVRSQLKALVRALAKVEAGCLNNPDVVQAWQRDGSYGAITLFSLLDGPNVRLNPTTKAYEDVAQDSVIMSWRFHFIGSPGQPPSWQIETPLYWILNGKILTPAPNQPSAPMTADALVAVTEGLDNYQSLPVQQEIFMPDAVDALLAASRDPAFLSRYAGTPSISRYVYFMKGHGGLVSPYQGLSTQARNAVEDSQSGALGKGSVFLFDPHGPAGAVTTTDFYSPLWDPEAVCRGMHRGETLGAVLVCQNSIRQASYNAAQKAATADGLATTAVPDPLIGHLNATSNGALSGFDQPEQQSLQPPPKVPVALPAKSAPQGNPAEGQGSPTEGQGSPTEGQGSPTEGQGSPTEGQGSPTKGQGSPTEGQGSPTEGQGSPTEGQGSPTEGQGSPTEGQGSPTEGQGSPTEGQGPDGLTLGEGFWRGGAQGAKTLVCSSKAKVYGTPSLPPNATYAHPLRLDMVQTDPRNPTSARLLEGAVRAGSAPMAYRFMGKAKAISQLALADPLVLVGSDRPSFVVFDTCYANMAPLELGQALPWVHALGAGKPTSWVVLANPIPVLEDALDYGMLSGFQYAYLTELLKSGIPASAGPKAAAPEAAPAAIPPPIGPKGPLLPRPSPQSPEAESPSPDGETAADRGSNQAGSGLNLDDASPGTTAADLNARSKAAQAISILLGDTGTSNKPIDDSIRKRRLHAFLFDCGAGPCNVSTASSNIIAFDQLAHITDDLLDSIARLRTTHLWFDARWVKGMGDFGENLANLSEYWIAKSPTMTPAKAQLLRLGTQIARRLPRVSYSMAGPESLDSFTLTLMQRYYQRVHDSLSVLRQDSNPEPILLRRELFQLGILHYALTSGCFLRLGNGAIFAGPDYDESRMTMTPYRPVSGILQALSDADSDSLRKIAPTVGQLTDLKAAEQDRDLNKILNLLIDYMSNNWPPL